ncbi:MAG: hypothetical protein ACI841_003290 [Planctomycetota bacterium]
MARVSQATSVGGVLSATQDITRPASAATVITASSTWHFQAWYQEPLVSGLGFTLTDAGSIVFLN